MDYFASLSLSRSSSRRSICSTYTSIRDCINVAFASELSPVMTRRRSVSPMLSSPSPDFVHPNRTQPKFPQTEDEHLYLFHEKIIWNQEKSLLPMAHDLSDWLNTILGACLTPTNFMESLDNGVTLCALARLIEVKAMGTPEAKVKPRLRGRVRLNARRGSFFARDNVAMFINFCRELQVHPNLLFETEDLVTHGEVRSILITLMEVGRLSVKYGVQPPEIVSLEHQIDRENGNCVENGVVVGLGQVGPHIVVDVENNKENPPLLTPKIIKNSNENLSDSVDSGLPVEVEVEDQSSLTNDNEFKANTDLDIKVNEVARISGSSCCCIEETRRNFRLRKLSEGKYYINGRTVFVRLLKGVHVMVRIGGGWETLEEFLVRNDPCRKIDPGRKGAERESSSANRRALGVYGHRPTSSPTVIMGYSTTPRNRNSFSACSTPQRSRHSSRSALYT